VSFYNEGSRRYQNRYDTRRLADRLEERFVSRPTIDESDRVFIEGCDMLFIATADAGGRPQCSYKGNGMFLTAGNAIVNPHVGLLFVDFEQRKRLRLNGIASHSNDDPLLAEYPEAQFLWRVEATEVFPNCPRYIHHYRLVERSRFVPRAECETPVPAWKTRDWASDVLAADDPANEPGADVIER
jgi:hypothetical protein